MNAQRTPVASAVALLMISVASGALAQNAPAKPAENTTQTIEVLGIRGALQQSLQTKRSSDTLVEVISAEDVGKMPDKNIADSLQRLPGVAVRADYDEAEKVAMRGTNPDMSLIVFNGHTRRSRARPIRTRSRPRATCSRSTTTSPSRTTRATPTTSSGWTAASTIGCPA